MKNKNIRNKGFHYILLLCVMILLFNCKEDQLQNEYHLTDEQKNLIPYTGNESIIFVSNKNDTIIYSGVECSINIEKSASESSGVFNLIEKKSCKFFNKTDSSFLFFNLSALKNSDYSYTILSQNKRDNSSVICNTFFYVSNIIKKDKDILKKDSMYFESLDFLGVKYDEVYKIKRGYQDNLLNKSMKAIYFSIKKGIIRIEFDNSDFLLIMRIKS